MNPTLDKSDRLKGVIRALAEAERVYGSASRALAWMSTPTRRLGNRTPMELLETDAGAQLVQEILVQIDEGMYV